MQPYHFNQSHYGAHSLILSAVKPGTVVLDVGCGPGYLAQHCPVDDVSWYGLDVNPAYVKQAKNFYTATSVYDLNSMRELPYEGVTFDTILMADVLEHVVDPMAVLRRMLTYLRPDGCVFISLPNVANFTVRLNLLRGRFDYTNSGILDKTHLHLYTRDTALALIHQCGLVVTDIKYSSDHFGYVANRWPLLAGLFAFNIVLFTRKAVESNS